MTVFIEVCFIVFNIYKILLLIVFYFFHVSSWWDHIYVWVRVGYFSFYCSVLLVHHRYDAFQLLLTSVLIIFCRECWSSMCGLHSYFDLSLKSRRKLTHLMRHTHVFLYFLSISLVTYIDWIILWFIRKIIFSFFQDLVRNLFKSHFHLFCHDIFHL